MAELFGFSITRLKKQSDPKQSFTTAPADDGTQTIAAGGYFGQYLDMEGTAKTEQDLIRRYREISLHPECDMAIEDIVNEAIVADTNDSPVEIELSNLNFSPWKAPACRPDLFDLNFNKSKTQLCVCWLQFSSEMLEKSIRIL